MKGEIRLVVTVLVVLSSCGGGVVDATTTPNQGVKVGAAVELTAQQESKMHQVMSEYASVFNLKPRSNTFVLYSNGTRWVVFTDQKPKSGLATVQGTVISPSELGGGKNGVIFANSVTVKTKGRRVPLSELQNNPKKYKHKLVRVTAPYRQISYLVEAQDMNYVETQSVSGFRGPSKSLYTAPGDAGRWATLNLSNGRKGQIHSAKLLNRLGSVRDLGVDRSGTRWWVNAKSTVDLIVLQSNSGLGFYVVNVHVNGKKIDSISQIHQHGKKLDGQVVTLRANVVGSQLSPQETLLKTAQCAPQSVTNPATGCIPIPTDVSIHSGIVFDKSPTSWSDVILYAGISNEQQSTPVTLERGRYQITGRVVSTAKIDPHLPDGYALVVYERKRIGPLSVSPGSAAKFRAEVQKRIIQQIKSPQSTSTAGSTTAKNPQSKSSTVENSQSKSPTKHQNTKKSTKPSPAHITITKTTIIQNPVAHGATAGIRVILRNSGDQSGSKVLKFNTDFDRQSEAMRTVHVPGKTTKTVTVHLPTDSQPSISATSIELNGERIGELHFTQANKHHSPQSRSIGGLSTTSGLLFAFISIVTWISAIVLETMRGIKSWRGTAIQTGEKPAVALLITGTITGGIAAHFFDQTILGILFVGCVFGLCAFVFGTRWVYRNL